MRMKVVTIITSELILNEEDGGFSTKHSVDIDDQDGISQFSTDILGAVLLGAMRSTEAGIKESFPRAGRASAKGKV